MGPATRNAIRTFQVDAGDPVTGRIDRQLLTRLNIVAADAGNDSSQAAQPRERPVSGIVLFDSFSDGNFTHDPAWTVYRGRFRVDGQRALRSYVEVTQPTADASPQRTGNAAKPSSAKIKPQGRQAPRTRRPSPPRPRSTTPSTCR